MYLASAYPNSALSAGALTVLALVMALSLALWLILVFRADKDTARDAQGAKRRLDVAALTKTAEDKQSDASHVPVDRQHGAAA
jgi:hypothetical protein